ncbi:SEC-C metal-binding domain-containing protein [Lysinibacillus fusiformis]|uniref:SEC-C metal-binding domain-containing protein n=1 Tax=Lysinibacillus fusiformis TaxID=28031 RepID=UPI003CFD7EDB
MAIGRNDICLCGSGKKYKKCCLRKDIIAEKEEMLEKRESIWRNLRYIHLLHME